MPTGLIALLIIFVVIVGAIATRRCTEFLFLGAILAVAVMYGPDAPMAFIELLEEVVGDPDNVWLWLIFILFGSFTVLLTKSRGTIGFQKIIKKVCTTDRRTGLATFLLGVIVFVDDYINILTVGICMRKLYDERKMPREALAYVMDSTGAPVCVLIPLSTWAVFYANLFYAEDYVSSQYSSGMSAYISAIPYCFYAFIALIFVFLFCMGVMPKLGAMKTAYQRVEETGMVYSEASRKYNMDDEEDAQDGHLIDFLVPLLALVIIGSFSGEVLLGVLAALAACLILYLPRRIMNMEDFFNNMIDGAATMLPILFMLVGSFSLATMCSRMGLTEFLIELTTPLLSARLFPLVSFLLLSVLAFITGSNWGMSAVVIPIFIPIAQALGANVVLTMAAIISGGVFGSHACFYTDATILSSSSAKIENMEHALSQWPYVLIAAIISSVLYIIFGMIMPIAA